MSLSLNIEDLQQKWDTFAPIYSAHLERVTLQSARSLFHNLRLRSACKILEVSCGPGSAAFEILTHPTLVDPAMDGFEYIATDLSQEMLKFAREKLEALIPMYPGSIQVLQANAEDLKFPDASFDRYFSNLCLQLVPNPEKMIKESYRVIRPGALAGFSVWGKKENGLLLTLVPQAIERAGLARPSSQSSDGPFAIGKNVDELRRKFKQAGFKNVVCWRQQLVFETVDIEFIRTFMMETMPFVKAMLDSGNYTKEEIKLIREKVGEILLERRNNGHPFGFEAILIIAEK